ncbi:MAG: four helix bundle protein [Bacteroidota bacterium]
MNKFKDLNVYRKALSMTKVVRQTVRRFPKDELFVLTSQFKRATDSIVLNIAEGAGNTTKKEFARFLDYSIRSAFECVGCLDIALENDFMQEATYQDILKQFNEIIAMLYGLQKSLLR